MVIRLDHPSDPRYLVVDELPESVTVDDLGSWRYGKALLFAPGEVVAVFSQRDGFGSAWVRPGV